MSILRRKVWSTLPGVLLTLLFLGACSQGGTLRERVERATVGTEQTLQEVGTAVQGTLERPVRTMEQAAGETTRKVGAGSTRLGEAIEEKTGIKGAPANASE